MAKISKQVRKQKGLALFEDFLVVIDLLEVGGT